MSSDVTPGMLPAPNFNFQPMKSGYGDRHGYDTDTDTNTNKDTAKWKNI